MRIGINLLSIRPGINGGVETYSISLLKALTLQRRSEDEYVVFVNRQGAQMPVLHAPNITRVVCDFNAENRALRYAWEHLILPRQFRKYGIQVAHSPGYQGPVDCCCPCVVTLPDVNFVALRDMFPLHQRAALDFFCKLSAKHASRVITISEFSKSEIVRHLGIPEERISVTPLACEPPPSMEGVDVSAIYNLPSDYVVTFAGNNWPHKNLPRLFAAMQVVRKRKPISLVIIGRLSPKLCKIANSFQIGALPLGFVPGEHVNPLLSRARLCVLPSLYEGFGLSVLEAQTAGTPLACSNAASLPEVAGAGARYFDPHSVRDIACAIEDCLYHPGYCHSLVRVGRDNAMRFSWEKTAAKTLAVYERVLVRPAA